MSPIRQQNLTLSKLFRTGGLALLLFFLAAYAVFQARFLIEGPEVTFRDLPGVVQQSRVVSLQGTASNITAIYLNGRPIVTDENGDFDESVVLENGYTVVSIDVTDLYGRHKHLEEPFVYRKDDSLTLLER